MTSVSLYQLRTTPLEKALPKLLEKILAKELRTLVVTRSQERLETLDASLWTYASAAFLPHGTARDGQPAHQPIWLSTTFENVNNASVLVVTEGMEAQGSFERCLDIFDGNEEDALEASKTRFHKYKSQGWAPTLWEQTDQSTWAEKKGA